VSVPFFSRRVVLATGNPGKLREMREILAGHGLEVVARSDLGIEPPVEDGDSFAANALIKARHAARAAKLPAIADDSGIEVDALGGRPGHPHGALRRPGADEVANNEKLLRDLADVADARRGARYRCAIVFVRDADDPSPVVAEASGKGASGASGAGRAVSAMTRSSSSRRHDHRGRDAGTGKEPREPSREGAGGVGGEDEGGGVVKKRGQSPFPQSRKR